MNVYKKSFVVVSVGLLSSVLCGLAFALGVAGDKADAPDVRSFAVVDKQDREMYLKSVNGTQISPPLSLSTGCTSKLLELDVWFPSAGEVKMPAEKMTPETRGCIDAALKGASVSSGTSLDMHFDPR